MAVKQIAEPISSDGAPALFGTGSILSAPVDKARAERAARAAKAFQRMLPGLTSYARALTRRDDVSVMMAATSPCTDGNKIYLRPPIALGDSLVHQRNFCDKRDETHTLLCTACAAREEMLVVLYHELGHIAYESFTSMSDDMKARVIADASTRAGTSLMKARIANYSQRDISFMEAAHMVHECFPTLVNALEDCRVNREMYRSRPGVEVMFNGLANRVFNQGIPLPDGTTALWSEAPITSQLMVGIFAKGAGYDYSGWFNDEIVSVLDDDMLTAILSGLRTARSIRASFELAFPVLVRLQELGYFKDPDEPEPEPEPTDEPGEKEQNEDVSPPEGSDDEGDSDGSEDDSPEESESADGDEPGDDGESESDGEPDSGDSGDDTDAPSADAESAPSEDPAEDAGSADESGEAGDGGVSDDASDSSGGSGADEPSDDDTASSDEGQADEATDGGGSEDSDQSAGDSPESGDEEGTDGGSDGNTDAQDEPVNASEGITGTGDSGPDSDGQEASSGGSGSSEPSESGDLDSTGDGSEVSESESSLPEGTVDDAQAALEYFGQHGPKDTPTEGELADEREVDRVIMQGGWFETPSVNVVTVRLHEYDKHAIDPYGNDMSFAWTKRFAYADEGSLEPVSESALGKSMLRMRVAFDDNKAARHQRNLKSGKVNARVLGRRVAAEDERLFHKRTLPGKKDYFVVIGLDISGSTRGENIVLEKAAVAAQAELLHRTGVPFVMYAHTAYWHDAHGSRKGLNVPSGLDLDMYLIKDTNDVWNDKTKERLEKIQASSQNLDGHTIEFYRKLCDRSNATDKVILYYTDGKFPAANADEEMQIIERELKVIKQRGITLLGVGINTDSPTAYGIDTCKVESLEDVPAVVRHLERRLSNGR